MAGGPSHTDNTLRKFGEVRTCGFRNMRADRQTDRQTRSPQYSAPLVGRSKNTETIGLQTTKHRSGRLVFSTAAETYPQCSADIRWIFTSPHSHIMNFKLKAFLALRSAKVQMRRVQIYRSAYVRAVNFAATVPLHWNTLA